ncbi:VPLPA-CTERM sorting domain-containing protein [Roseovarius sp. ZX-A-9]|uniref:VPLPA-CTERM sorting domain-containing protein n=1 Tax=Roseovarius sp. ZX-A-9 TaxID=3014783 RepID=UPI00232EBBC6|nr:VPLPA-CTERM sorting domain-containing protein [Roseovarius sp. ZX-A-9]
MEKKLFGGLTLATIVAMSSAALAATVTPVFTDVGIDTSGTAQSTRMYRADLTGLGLTEIGAITVNDSNSGVGGSAGIYSGFDLDAIFLDLDGSLATSADRIFATSFLYSAGSVRGGGTPTSTSGGPFNGASSATSVDEGWATLGDIDGIFFGTGSLTLGDGGSLTAVFAPTIPIGPSLYLFAGEVSGDAGETLNGLVQVADLPPPLTPVPLPAGLPLMLSGLLGLGFLKRRKKVD